MRRGDVRAAVLVLLDEQPHTGYSLMEELERRSNGAWRPSPGSVYPTLQQLEDEGLIAPEPGEGRTPYGLTERARPTSPRTARSSASRGRSRPRASARSGSSCAAWSRQIAAATFQVGAAGDDAQVARAKELLAETRRSLYKILADDKPAD